ncbi:hypothetical protein [uncultured Eubacterium sp.]|uniref:endonuclease/exonuclease/phosphatase family protein n=1 Tax=uncultured Eubacterium sp. TaxID=165185 RepID=UPI002634423B|nr:hypothetical protein [uncultured Eubacterium sp.]
MTQKENKMSKKICVWNINSATNKNIFTPEFVGEEIEYQDSDFFILTEFCKTQNYKSFIQKYFVNKGYDYVLSNNPANHNDILVAWKKDRNTVIEKVNNIETNYTTPNFAYVKLQDTRGFEFVLAGVRITIESYENREKQLRSVLDTLKLNDKVIIGGDFNCLRRGTTEKKWNISILSQISEQAGFKLVTPKGQSIYAENAISEEYEFAEDHFVVKNMLIENEVYDRNFTDRYKDVYLHGKDFSVYDSGLRRNRWSINVGSGIPDYAILRGSVFFNDQTNY